MKNDVQAVRRAMLLATKPLVTDDALGFGVTAEAAAQLLVDLATVSERHTPGAMELMRQAMNAALQSPAPATVQ